MKGHQTLPDVVRPRNYRKAASSVTFQVYVVSKRGFAAKPRYRRSINTGGGLCVSDPSVVEEEGGRHQGISWDHPWAATQKQHCGTDRPIQENSTSCPIRSSILHELLTSQNGQSRFNISCCSTVTTTVHKQSYLWRTLHRPRSRRNLKCKHACKLTSLPKQQLQKMDWNKPGKFEVRTGNLWPWVNQLSFKWNEKSLVPVKH